MFNQIIQTNGMITLRINRHVCILLCLRRFNTSLINSKALLPKTVNSIGYVQMMFGRASSFTKNPKGADYGCAALQGG
ncbi:hypothetical protein J2S05_000434 [Alkalicoccobacillus murimartini]|uniref:Uncharacterized protein n=1 Tax=Alkalicoccobacillus murimartini TaxID=171685 RepID=A0ABT9YCS7_9BACI|nr:hypothetical protein [Alkalicoccobacillus murimartini]